MNSQDSLVGKVLFHKSGKTKTFVTADNGTELSVELDKPINKKNALTIKKERIGEFLFFNINDMDLDPMALLVKKPEYERFNKGNVSLLSEKRIIFGEMQNKGIHDLLHFTRIENLPSILKHGLIPVYSHRYLVQPQDGDGSPHPCEIKAFNNDIERMDRHTECSSLSVTFPNYKLFYKFQRKDRNAKWVVLKIDTDILWCKSVFYCHTNAAHIFPNTQDTQCLSNSDAFKHMFAECVKTRNGDMYRQQSLPNSMTTDPQAEIMVKGTIEQKNITSVVFESDDVREKYLRQNSINIETYVDAGVFGRRIDWNYWQKKD